MINEILVTILKIGHGNYVFMLGLFIIFIYAVKRIIKIAIETIYVVIASALFPVFLNMFGISVPINMETIVSFITMGLGIFFVFVLFRGVYHVLGIFEKIFKGIGKPLRKAKEREKEKKIDELIRNYE